MRRIVNLTQHVATSEQVASGVFEPVENKAAIIRSLTIGTLPAVAEIEDRANWLGSYAENELLQSPSDWEEGDGYEDWVLPENAAAMIGGAPYLMSALERNLVQRKITPVYVFSKRESVEELQADGSIIKTAIFRHLGFVEV